jgi:cystathionine beta-lyase/cystathionine gamma-synthase
MQRDSKHDDGGFDELCVEPPRMEPTPLNGLGPAIYPGAVYRCDDPDQAFRLLAGLEPGYVYQRDGHPNADWLADKLGRMHAADWAVIAASGMAALSVAALATLQHGDHVLVSDQLYGRTTQLLRRQWSRLGVTSTLVNALDLADVQRSVLASTRMLVVETLSNPMLRVVPLPELVEFSRARGICLLVDNTFATPALCRPLAWGADLVMESVSKMINGHSDVMLGLLAGLAPSSRRDTSVDSSPVETGGPRRTLAEVRDALSVWGLASSPFDCWLAMRGLTTLHLRMERASENAMELAAFLERHARVSRVCYPGLPSHPDHARAQQLFGGENEVKTESHGKPFPAGSMVTFELEGGQAAVTEFLRAAPEIPFCPSLGEVSTTVSHPASTSHRSLEPAARQRLGIGDGTLRLSVGTESLGFLTRVLDRALGKLL